MHQLASFCHVYIHLLPTVNVDSIYFNDFARIFAETGSGPMSGMFYVRMVGYVYYFFGYSQFLGCQLSQVSFSISAIMFMKLWSLLELDFKRMPLALLIFGLLPSCVFTTAVTMRESFQMAGFLIFVYGFLRFRSKTSGLNLAIVCAGSLWLLFFHNGFALFLVLAFPFGFVWATGSRPERLLAATALAFAVLFLFGGPIWKLMLDQSHALQQVAEGRGLEYIGNYAKQVFEGRTDFEIYLDLSSVGGFFTTAPIIYIYYLFSPLPWQIRGTIDLVGLLEGLVRMYLLFWAVVNARRLKGERGKIQIFLLLLFLLIEATWAAGTSNWGTAIRHRLVAWPLLVLLGMPSQQQAETLDETGGNSRSKSRRQQIRELRQRQRENRGHGLSAAARSGTLERAAHVGNRKILSRDISLRISHNL